MQVKDVWEEIKEAAGMCSDTVLYRTLTRAVELLANEGLFDPLLGTVDLYADGAYLLALPRDVKTPIRLNIDNNPAFVRSRLYEYQANTNGSVDGEEVGWQWHERGYSPIQDERKLPSQLRYQVTNQLDEGKTLTVQGVDAEGRRQKWTLTGKMTDPDPSEVNFHEVRHVTRDETIGEGYLLSDTGAIGRYEPTETDAQFRVIKISQTGVAIRMLYRKHVFKLTSQEDIIPLHSPMAVIRACEAVRLMMKSKYADAQQVLSEAIRHITREQDTRDESQTLAVNLEITNAINRNISTNDVMIVADFYDLASEILGPMGRQKLFDRINDGIEILQNKSKWDASLGWCDIWKASHCPPRNSGRRDCGDGYFVLPRYVKAVEALNFCDRPMIPRNRWFEYHLNGTGSRNRSSWGTWDDVGDTVIINMLPRDPTTRRVIPTQCFAIPEDSRDEDTVIRIFGIERLANGVDAEVWRDGVKGWLCPCKASSYTLPLGSPAFVRIDRIKRDANSKGFIKLIGVPQNGTSFALVGDQGDDSADADNVEELMKSFNPDEIILLGDNSYRGDGDHIVYNFVGRVQPQSNFFMFMDHAYGTPEVVVGSILKIDGNLFTVVTVTEQASTDADWYDTQYLITTLENLVNVNPDTDAELQETASYAEDPVPAMDRDVGKHWRKYIYPFLGDPDAAPLADGETDATENHLWPVPGNHDWTENEHSYTMRDRQDDLGSGFPTRAFRIAPATITNIVSDFDTIDLFFNPQGLTWEIDVYGNGVFIDNVPGFINPMDIDLPGVSLHLPPPDNDPSTDLMQVRLTKRVESVESLDHYTDYFTLPSESGNERYYTKILGDAQFFFLDSDEREPDGIAVDSIQYDWFVAQVSESTATWKIVILHHTVRSSSSVHPATPGSNPMAAWDWAGFGINAVIGGHHHGYERWEEDGVLYLTVGTGNDDLYGFISSGLSVFSKKRLQRHGAMFARISEHQITFSFRDTDGNELDSVILSNATVEDELLLGYWYPDELEPTYRLIKVPSCRSQKVRIRYRKRTSKVSSLDEIVNIRSRPAIECILRALAIRPKDVATAAALETQAAQYILEEQYASNPIQQGGLQFDPRTCPAVTENIT